MCGMFEGYYEASTMRRARPTRGYRSLDVHIDSVISESGNANFHRD
jgi:hypothetical protein